MRFLKIILLSMIAAAFLASFVLAAGMEGSAEKGKAYFNDAKFAGGAASCGSCHPNGKGLDKAAVKMQWKNPAGTWLNLEDTINVCIIMGNKGKAIDPKSAEMMDLIAYLKSLGKETKEMPKKGKTGGY
ncbi:MAG: hypothetical protein HZA14_04780 [Nitrospirae bacterium]|nr:hypothetical protein [Nitrospirota bacterium]